MILYLSRRAGLGALVFFSVTTVCFFLYNARGAQAIAVNLVPADATPDDVALKATSLGLDRPLAHQYTEWLGGLIQGDLGRSFVSGQDVTAIMGTRVPVTLSLVATTLVLTLVFSVLLGVLAATRGGVVDRVVQLASVVAGAVPGYWLALILVLTFSLGLKLFPATGFTPMSVSLTGWLSTIVLPSVAISLGSTLSLAVWIRSSIIDLQRKDFVRTLRARGISPRAVMYRHVLRNAAAPTVQVLGLMMITLLGGSVIVERVFALPGIGTMTLSAGQQGDIPVVLGGVTFFVLVVVVINIVVDLINGFLNPKVRVR